MEKGLARQRGLEKVRKGRRDWHEGKKGPGIEQDGKWVSIASLALATRSAFFQSLRHRRSSPGTKYQPFDNSEKKLLMAILY